MVASLVEFDNVVKDYPVGLWGRRTLRAVDGVSFAVQPGEVFGLCGPNRAGKTTLVKMLLSLCRPTSGRVLRFGQSAEVSATLARIGYVHEKPAFPPYLSASQLLHYYGALSLLPEPEVRQRVPQLLERVGLADRADDAIARFSKGMAQRLALAQALLTDPDLLVLDEPCEGLDLDGRQIIRDVMAHQRERGRSVLLISHLLAEMEQVCDRAAVLVGGRLVYAGAVAELTGRGGGRSLEDALRELYRQGQPAPADNPAARAPAPVAVA